MNIAELIPANALEANLESNEKIKVIEELCELLVKAYPEIEMPDIVNKIKEREKLGSTGIGNGVAIPHCKLSGLDRILCAFGRSPGGVDFESVDMQPAQIFFILVAPEDAAGEHLKALARISRLCQKPAFRSGVMNASDESEIYRVMLQEDSDD